VIAANDADLSTVALRPHLIWGPGDRHLIPRLIERARCGRLRHLAPEKLVDSVYIEDAGRAHWDAYDRLEVGADCAGKAYFITQGEPWPIADLIEGILEALGESCPRRTISPKLAMCIGGVLEIVYRLLRIKSEPVMTRFIADQLSTAHWFSIDAARRDLGYVPQRSITEALTELSNTYTQD
jgi:nucleoside-diphosphate-sugar epimerase